MAFREPTGSLPKCQMPNAMKKRLLIASLFWLLPLTVQAQATTERIVSFDVQARLEADRTLTVTEEIAYDFGAAERHGMFRVIPERYERAGGSYNYRYQVTGVTRDGRSEPFKTSRSGGKLTVKIGDPDRTVTGRHVYALTYRTDRAVNFFDGEGELYWNVTGNDWKFPILASSLTLTGPDGFNASAARKICYTGLYGSTEQGCSIVAQGNQAAFKSNRAFGAGEGLTVAVRFPPGLIAEPTALDRLLRIVRDNGVLFLPIATLLAMLWLWHTKGRDPKGRGTIIPQYEPPRGLTPAEMSGLREQDVPQKAVTATILDLARRGYLKINFSESKGWLGDSLKYAFIKRKAADGLTDFEAVIYDGLFESGDEVSLEELKHKFYKHIGPFKKDALESLVTRNLFSANPAKVRGKYLGAALVVAFLAIWLAGGWLNPLTTGAAIASAAVIAIVGWFMPTKTREGAVALEEVEGFKWFLSVTEKDRLAFHNAPALKPEQFHAFLPAAIVFGVEKQWAGQFKGLDVPPPDYATGAVLMHWSALNFASSLGSLNTAAAASAYAAPSSAGSGGSGFGGGGSGGGGGGGGGGSW